MPKAIERELGEINATLKSIHENQREMHDDLKQFSTCMTMVKIDTETNTDFRTKHYEIHNKLETRLEKVEDFKTRVYGIVAGVSLAMGVLGSQLVTALNSLIK